MSDATALNKSRRSAELAELGDGNSVDILVIGGGITGVGIALDAATRGRLAANDRLTFIDNRQDLRDAISRGAAHTELWHLVLVLFLGLLLAEVTLTRRMVRGGYQQEAGAP